FLPSGYSMPSFTLLGRDVVRLPFILETSLGHEVLHQWFGNLVYVDYDKGNWSEGLTTYLSDHLYEEQKGRGFEYRKQILIDYESYVHENNDFPIKDFTGRTDFSSKAIGYGKAAMVFHMLRLGMGDAAFNRSLRDLVREKSFQRASWEDIKSIAEKNSRKDWGSFFKQWIDNPGLPELNVGTYDLKQKGTKYEATFTIDQKPKVYTLALPLSVSYMDGSAESFTVPADKDSTPVTLSLSGIPEKIVIDGGYDIARQLSYKELPPVVAGVIGAEKPVLVLPVKDEKIYAGIVKAFKDKGAVDKPPSEISETGMKASTFVVLGNDNPVAERFFGGLRNDAGFSVTVKKNPWAPGKVVGIINGKSGEEAEEAFEKIFHYGKYSELFFDKGKIYIKKTAETDRGINVEHKDHTVAVLVSAVTSPREVLARVSGKRIVYVGEYHDRFSNHAVQLEVIRSLHRKNKKIAIGMEMFQRPFQKVLDEYIAGTIDERAMLKGTEYFKRWGFDYNLYRPVLSFARDEKIPVIALNIRTEIVDKVSKGGIDSLSEGEKKEVPLQTDFSDEDYKTRLREIFQTHKGLKEKNFDFFYQSQILWDESMSQSIDDFLKNRPDFRKDGQVVVIAGSGHLYFGSGIPKRTFRRNGLDYAVILNDIDIEKDVADYLIYPESIEGVTAPKIMAVLTDIQGQPAITDFPEGSISEKAGLRVGDVILSIDAVPVKTIDDIRLELLYKKKGDSLKVKIRRKRFLLGNTEKQFTVVL
ncbi:MAG TPA: ChaN family lipoprotein, partial [Dissulfurispiraceae bacterium]|nr:ChaN family lipoprotein [Dissulfurispiraceae bacterium]